MMQESEQLITVPTTTKALAKVEPQMNSQGEIIAPAQETQAPSSELQQPSDNFDDVTSLGDTDLAISPDALCPPTDDTGLEHKIISCGHVLKSTHDLARWSEKTGARRVNGIESIDAVSDLAVNLEPNRGNNRAVNNSNNDPTDDVSGLFNEGGNGRTRRASGRGAVQQQWRPVEGEGLKSEVIACWPVLKSTHDQAQLSEKRGRNAVNQAGTSAALEELAVNQGSQGGQAGQGGQQRGRGRQQQGGSHILQSWPVMKSTHDLASREEKRTVNDSTAALEEVVRDTQAGGSSLQSGLDTQGGSHMQLDDTQKLKETPEQVMVNLHIHV